MIILLRLVLAIAAGAVGNFLGRESIPPNAPIEVPVWTGAAATLIFALAGFLLPDFLSFLAKAGIARVAQELVKHLPQVPTKKLKLRLPKQANLPKTDSIVCDTSAIVDGRIEGVVNLGFLTGNLLLIPSIISELQHLADSQDSLKRARGRKALELLEAFKKDEMVNLKVLPQDPKGTTVDEKIVNLAKKLKAKILTCDYNLAKVAKLKNLQVLNVNELSQAVRLQVLPGEVFKINLVHLGKTKNQAVGYLSDGTMIVVENGAKFVGKAVEVQVYRSFQTVAGRMVFAKLAS